MTQTPSNIWGLKQGFILASRSPKRLELLKNVGLIPEKVVSADIDETPLTNELPARYVRRISAQKAQAVMQKYPGQCIVTADTIIAVGRRIVRKAADEKEAIKNLHLLSGRKHRVVTAFSVVKPDGKIITKVNSTSVTLKKLDETDIRAVIQSGEWQNVAGYQIEGVFGALVKNMNGSYASVVGIPVHDVANVLRGVLCG